MSFQSSSGDNNVPGGVPSDDDLYDHGWAKHWDPNRKAYYYYSVDGSAPTTWENPLQGQDASTFDGSFRSFAGRSFAPGSAGVASIAEHDLEDDSDSDSSSSSFDDNYASFGGGESQASLTLSALMGGTLGAKRAQSVRSLGAQRAQSVRSLTPQQAAAGRTRSAAAASQSNHLDVSESIAEEDDESFVSVEGEESFQTNLTKQSMTLSKIFPGRFRASESELEDTGTEFDNETNQDTFAQETFKYEPSAAQAPAEARSTGTVRSFGGTDRKPLRMPRGKPPPGCISPTDSTIDWDGVYMERDVLQAEAEVAQKRKAYLALLDDERHRYSHRPVSKPIGCLLCLLVLIGMGLGGYFLGTAAVDHANGLMEPTQYEPTSAPTTAPLVLPDYTQQALQNPVSEQARALNWVTADPNYSTLMSKEEKEATFALMTLYATTGGSSWERTDDFTLPESAYAYDSYCQFPYYSCAGDPVKSAAPLPASSNTPAPTPAGNTTTPGTTAPGGGLIVTTPPPVTTAPGGGLIVTTPPPDTTAPGGGGLIVTTPPPDTTAPPEGGLIVTTPPPVTTAPGGGFVVAPGGDLGLLANRNGNARYLRQLQEQQVQQLELQLQRELAAGEAKFGAGDILNLTNQGFLQGTLPPELALLTDVQTFECSNQPGLIGTIPDTIKSWGTVLFTFILTGNSLDGTIPTIMGQLKHVRTLWLNDNKFTGTIPQSLSLLTQLQSLQLQNNQLSGTIPPSVAAYPYVHLVNLHNNQLRGPVPTFYVPGSLASQVRIIKLSNNSFSGTIPTDLGGLTNLQVLHLHNNLNINGTVPTEICALPKLQQLTVDCNNVACICAQCQCPTGGNPRNSDLIKILPQYTQPLLANGNSPQSLAFVWLNSDPALSSYSNEQQLQRFALATLYYATSAPPDYKSWKDFQNWLNLGDGAECTWAMTEKVFYRVPDSTDNVTICAEGTSSAGGAPYQAFQGIWLSNNTLDGTLPNELAILTDLKILELQGNTFSGPIPTYINALTALNVLDLEATGVTGPLPTEVIELPQLNKLYLGDNMFSGTLPSEIGKMTALDTLQLNGNQFNGTFPGDIARLGPTLKRLYMSSNALLGALPVPEINLMVALEELYLDNNDLSGDLEALPFTDAPSLAHVVMSANEFTGTVPTLFGSMPKIQVLLLDENQFFGPIPVELVQAKATLQWLHLSGNLLTGPIPIQVGDLVQLREFHVANNKLTGSIPIQLNQLAQLRSLDLAFNRLTGTIPGQLRFLQNLNSLKLDHNNFNGNLPRRLADLTNLIWLDVSWNALGDKIPTELGTMSNLQWMYLERNNMIGPVMSELGQLTKLKELSLYGMQLTGTIPTELGLLSDSLTAIFLHENYLEGPIPSELGLLTKLNSLWLHQLSLTGSVPTELCYQLAVGELQTLAIDCQKVACTCGCACPTTGGDAPREDPTLVTSLRTPYSSKMLSIEAESPTTVKSNIFRHPKEGQ